MPPEAFSLKSEFAESSSLTLLTIYSSFSIRVEEPYSYISVKACIQLKFVLVHRLAGQEKRHESSWRTERCETDELVCNLLQNFWGKREEARDIA